MLKARGKLISLLTACMALVLMLVMGIATLSIQPKTASAAITGSGSFVKVTSAPSDWSGDYLIVYETGKVAFNGSLTTLDATKNNTAVTINNGVIDGTDAMKKIAVTIAPTGSNYTIKTASGYYIGETSTSNGLDASTSTQYTNTITFSNGKVTIKASGGNSLQFNSASDQMRFRYFKSSQQAISLFKWTPTVSSCEHDNEESEITKAATCTETGVETFTCECGETRTEVIPALGHNKIQYDGQAPTCTDIGWEAYETCSRCDYNTKVEIEATGHDIESAAVSNEDGTHEQTGTCSTCGESTSVTEDCIYGEGVDGEDEVVYTSLLLTA